MTPDEFDVSSFVSGLTPEQIECRTIGHRFKVRTAKRVDAESTRGKTRMKIPMIETVSYCTCGCTKVSLISGVTGLLLSSSIDYKGSPGYLAPPGSGYFDQSRRGQVRLAHVQRYITEETT